MKGSIAIAIGLLVAFGDTSHATARYDPNEPVDDVSYRLSLMQRQIDAQRTEITAIRADNQRLRTELVNLLAINNHVALVNVHGRPTVRFNAVNLQVVNGTGDTSTANGTGNLLIGYDRLRQHTVLGNYEEECSRGVAPYGTPIETGEQCTEAGGDWRLDHKDGSHYLVVGDEHNYSQWSGIVTGWGNTANSRWASVTGGYLNRAYGVGASVSGGAFGVAMGDLSSIGGGYENRARGNYSSVSGGWAGVASGTASSVSGGFMNEASGIVSAVTGGTENDASADGAAVGGGTLNHASGHWSSVSGGAKRTAADTHGWAGGNY